MIFRLFLENKRYGTTYTSCIGNPPLLMDSAGEAFGIFGLLLLFGACILSCWIRSYLRKQDDKQFIRRVQTAVAEVQQPRTVYIVVDPSSARAPLTNEQPPPSYEQTQK
jgi:hypothetical protein